MSTTATIIVRRKDYEALQRIAAKRKTTVDKLLLEHIEDEHLRTLTLKSLLAEKEYQNTQEQHDTAK